MEIELGPRFFEPPLDFALPLVFRPQTFSLLVKILFNTSTFFDIRNLYTNSYTIVRAS